ncbi:Transposon Tf2-8 polyprotein [Labeo rohita]|uniref:Gypsy retrotransposon integrase-like protein 1 n=1 Tax=Labeo rohita TaxID=84645 RepID=A0ABQ8L3H5_LABRO|nr:Transposon Tf2-8 polyprotein [Labeo rohita]
MFILRQQWSLHLKLSSQAPTPHEISNLSLIPVTLHSSRNSLSVSALIDSVKTIQGKPLGRGKVRYSSPLITLQVGLFHKEQLRLLVLEDSTVCLILGHPWLHLRTPVLCWDPCDILQWGKLCHDQCLSELPLPRSISIPLASTKIESPEPEITPEIPAEYMAFQDVFSKQAATLLPPHRPWDFQAMEEYIAEALQQGFIQPSTLPAASSFFFVGKKDGGLCPCIDYRQLNSQIIQQPYPLPLVPATLEDLRGAQVFFKLDLRSAYNLIRIQVGYEWKTAFITPTGHYKYRVMPYGLSISPSVFQMFMNEHVQQVLEKLREHSLYLKLEKCEFYRSSVQFLGYVISAEGFSADSPAEPEPILPPSVIVSPIIWDLENNIRHATLQEPAPSGCPEGKIYVPSSQRLHLLGTVHESPGSGHPGSRRTLSLLQGHYWWPSMHRNVTRFVLSCSVCPMFITPRHLPTGKLIPLPISQRPWSHIGVDFVTDLPNCEGNTCILVTVDGFSKSCKFIPLKGLPTALETAEHLFQHIFQKRLSQTGVLNSSLMYGQLFSNSSASLLTFPLVITHRLMARLRERSKSSDVTSGHTVKRTNTAGAGSSRGPRDQLLTTGSKRVRECGTQLITIFNEPSIDIRGLQTPERGSLPNTTPGTYSGCPPATYVFGYPAVS